MRASLRALRKDLFEFQRTGRGLILAMLAPPIIVFLVGQLSVHPSTLRILVAGQPLAGQQETTDRLVALLRELPGATVDVSPTRPSQPHETARQGAYDFLIVPDELGTGHLAMYSAATEPARVGRLAQLASGIEQGIAHSGRASGEVQAEELTALGLGLPRSLYLYYPRAADRASGFLPMTIALVVCFFPFILAAPSLIEEYESHTIEGLLSAPGMTHDWLLVGKVWFSCAVSLFVALSMFVSAEGFYQFYFKDGFLAMLGYTSLAIAASSLLGLTVSAVVRSSVHASAAAALYFVCLLLFSGFFVELDQSAAAVRVLGSALPLAPLDALMKAWMFGGRLPPLTSMPATLLVSQTIGYGTVAYVVYRWKFVRRV